MPQWVCWFCLFTMMLGAPPLAAGAQVVRGDVVDSLTSNSLVGARVILLGAHDQPLDSTRTDSNGLFQFVTPPGRYRLRAAADQYVVSAFPPFDMRDDEVKQFRLLLPIGTPPNTAGIGGVVTSTAGLPITNAQVHISSSAQAIQTDERGQFRSLGLRPGSTTVRIQAIGFEPRTIDVNLPTDRVITLEREALSVSAIATELAPIIVETDAAETRRPLTEFYKRRAQSNGRFMTRAEFMQQGSPQKPTDVLQRMGVVSDRGSLVLRRTASRGGFQSQGDCPPLVYFDGRYLGNSNRVNIDTMLPLADLEAVEVYSSTASMPVQFNRTGATCGVLVFWTR